MFNSGLLTPRNLLVIGAISIIARVISKPLLNAVDKKA